MISLNTLALKEALSKCGKCAKNDKTAPLTQLINIKTVNEHTLSFTSTDERNTFSYFLTDITANFDNINICVLIEQLTKLVSKFSCTTTQLNISDSNNELTVSGDGDYKISSPIDANGKPIEYPEIEDDAAVTDVFTGNVSELLAAAKFCEGSLLKATLDIQVEDYPRTNYYFGKDIISLDGFLATRVSGNFVNFDTLISPSTLKLLSLFTDEDFSMYKTKTYNVFKCSDCVMYTVEPEGLDAYPTEVASQLIDSISGNTVDISAGILTSALDRLNLFTDDRSDNSIKIVFNDKGMFAYTIDGACVEQISSEPCKEFSCYINVISLISMLKAYSADIIKLYYGDDRCFKFEFNNVGQIIVLSDFGDN